MQVSLTIDLINAIFFSFNGFNRSIDLLANACIDDPEIIPLGSPQIFQTVFLFLLYSSLSSISSCIKEKL